MNALPKLHLLTEAEYLAAEEATETRHEYYSGQIFAMAGTTRDHSAISINFLVRLHAHLRGRPCRVYMNDVKVRVAFGQEIIYYYPDLFVSCDAKSGHQLYSEAPILIIEVLSPSTARVDRREKFFAYMQIPTLQEYVLLDSRRMAATVFRRGANWATEILTQPTDLLRLESIDWSGPLSELYENVTFSPTETEEED